MRSPSPSPPGSPERAAPSSPSRHSSRSSVRSSSSVRSTSRSSVRSRSSVKSRASARSRSSVRSRSSSSSRSSSLASSRSSSPLSTPGNSSFRSTSRKSFSTPGKASTKSSPGKSSVNSTPVAAAKKKRIQTLNSDDENSVVSERITNADDTLTKHSSGDDDDDVVTKPKETKQKRLVLDSDSSDEGVLDPLPPKSAAHVQSPSNAARKPIAIHDSDTSDEGVIDPNPIQKGKKDSEDSSDEIDSTVRNKKGRKILTKKKNEPRKSKKAAMLEIRAESSRLLRESVVGLHYHRPKVHTLDEFLARKKGTPEIVKDIKLRPGEVNEDAEKILAERERIAQEFYKSDEEAEDDADEDYNADLEAEKDDEMLEADSFSGNLEEGDMGSEKMEDSGNQSAVVAPASQATDADPSHNDHEESPIQTTNGDPCSIYSEYPVGDATSATERASDLESQEKMEPAAAATTSLERDFSVASAASDSLRLFMEEDTPATDIGADAPEVSLADEDVIFSSQKHINETSLSEKTPVMSKKLEMLSKKYDISALQKSLDTTPKLASGVGDSNEVIDLDGDDGGEPLPVGMKDLMNRFVMHVKASNGPSPNLEKDVNLTVVKKVPDGEGGERLETEEITYHSSMVDFRQVDQARKQERPGAQHLALRKTLREKIAEKKRKEREKRTELKKFEDEENIVEEFEENEESNEDEDEDGDDDQEPEGSEAEGEELDNSDASGEEEDDDDEEEEGNEEEIEEAFRRLDKKRKKMVFLDDEAEEGDSADSAMNEDHEEFNLNLEDSSDEQQANDPFADKQPLPVRSATRFGSPEQSREKEAAASSKFTPSSQMNDELPRWTPFAGAQEEDSADATLGGSKTARKKLGFQSLFDQSDPRIEDVDDVIGLCSGSFATQQPIEQDTPDTIILTQCTGESDVAKLATLPTTLSATVGRETAPEAEKEQAVAASPQVKKRKRIIVVNSDDEDENEDDRDEAVDKPNEQTNEDMSDVEGEELVENEKEEDEEEEDVTAKFKGFVNNKGRLRKEFLEQEAELSGSEPESGDEDERGLNRLEAEEGDFDDLDLDEVRDEVGQIHHRQLMDADKHEVRLLQEAFLEDGELHSERGRARTFKWKGIDDADDVTGRNVSDEEREEDDLHQEDEEKRRQERAEREKWLQESMGQNDEDEEAEEDSQFFTMASKAIKRLTSKSESKLLAQQEKAQPKQQFQSPKPKTPLQLLSGNARGSFLCRKSEELQKLAQLTKGKNEAIAGSGAKNTKNFVFASVSPGKESTENSSAEASAKREKAKSRQKEPPTKKQKFDRTLNESSMDTIFGFM